jgi:hypothetical protein
LLTAPSGFAAVALLKIDIMKGEPYDSTEVYLDLTCDDCAWNRHDRTCLRCFAIIPPLTILISGTALQDHENASSVFFLEAA